MAQVFTIEPNPHWVIIDNFSRLPNGAAIYTYRSVNPTEFKPAFQDAAGATPYGQPITGFGNGTMPPMFWEFDDTQPSEGYYIRVYDSADPATQNFLWDFQGLFGGGSGGGGTVTTNNDIENLVVNGQFFRHADDQASAPTFVTLAPSNNAGFVGTAFDPPNDGPVTPDIIFAKNNASATDSITFVPVTPIGSNNLGLNPTPEIYVNYTCAVAGAAETYKYFQFPLVKGLQNTSGQTFSIKIFGRLNSGVNSVTLKFRQFFGNGGAPSADVLTPIGGGPITLTAGAWTSVIINSEVVPSITGKTLGTCGNDALYLQIALPLSPNLINVDFILPSIYLGSTTSDTDFHTLDEVDAIVNSPRTGDIRTSLNAVLLGWVNMNDGTIGSATSGATSRANIDTFPLFKLIWETFQATPTFAPIYTSAGAASTYGASAVADFTANKRLSLTRNLGRVMAGALPAQVTQAFTTPVANTLTVASTASFVTGAPVTVSASTVPALVNGTTYYAIVLTATTMSLATTAANAIAGTPITFGIGAGTGNVIIAAHALGFFTGNETHTLTQAELPASLTNVTINGTVAQFGAGGPAVGIGPPGGTPTVTNMPTFGSGTAHSIMQPTVFMNVFIKL